MTSSCGKIFSCYHEGGGQLGDEKLSMVRQLAVDLVVSEEEELVVPAASDADEIAIHQAAFDGARLTATRDGLIQRTGEVFKDKQKEIMDF